MRVEVFCRKLLEDDLDGHAGILGHLGPQVICLLYHALNALTNFYSLGTRHQRLVELSNSLHNIESVKDLLPIIRPEVVQTLLKLQLRISQWLLRRIVGSILTLPVVRKLAQLVGSRNSFVDAGSCKRLEASLTDFVANRRFLERLVSRAFL
jgi:hypothetical protein